MHVIINVVEHLGFQKKKFRIWI